jgi:hypothetical protein
MPALAHIGVGFASKSIAPNDTGMLIFLDTSITLGLGLWRDKTIGLMGEYGTLLLGIAIYIMTLKKIKNNKKVSLQ